MVNNTLVIGFGHRARSGKDTAVAEIVRMRQPELDVRRYAFADILKREVNACLDAFPAGQRHWEHLWSPDYHLVREDGVWVQLRDYPWVVCDPNPPMDDPLCPYGKQRTLLQWWGTEFRRNINKDYWVNRLREKLNRERPKVALLTDMRFFNEFDFADERVRVDRAELPPLTPRDHQSEKELAAKPDEEWTRILQNNGTLEEFQNLAVDAFDTIMEFYPRGYGLV